MRVIGLLLVLSILFGCAGFQSYKDTMDDYLGGNVNNLYWLEHKNANYNDYRFGYPAYKATYQTNDSNYTEHAMKFISPFSKTQGICTTIFKVRKLDNIIVSWRSEGKKSDCVWRSATE